MYVPNRQLAEVPIDKISAYLLATDHPEGGDKAVWFIKNGFSPAKPEELIEMLLQHVQNNIVANSRSSIHGLTYAVDGGILSPTGKRLQIRSVWVTESDQRNPRFVTAYPLDRIKS